MDDSALNALIHVEGFLDTVHAHAPALLESRAPYAVRARASVGTREPVQPEVKQVLYAAGPVADSVVAEWHRVHLDLWIASHLQSFSRATHGHANEGIRYALDVILDVHVLQSSGAAVDIECVGIGCSAVDKHVRTLASKRQRLVNQDEYGTITTEAWEREKQYFVETVVARECGPLWEHSGSLKALGVDVVLDNVSRYIDEVTAQSSVSLELNAPADLEAACAVVLRNSGWIASVTQMSGDQGVDIVATRGVHTLAVQCKLYSSPVGNKAVQEVSAGRVHYAADLGIVVSNAGFTPSARALASTNNVLLLSIDEFAEFANSFAST